MTATFTFVVLRCPFERLVSCFLDKIVGVYPYAWALTPPSEGELNPADLTFREFVWILSKGKLRSDSHWRPQIDFLVYDHYDRYFDFRNIPAMSQELFERIGLVLLDVREKTLHSVSRLERVSGRFVDTPVRELSLMKYEGKAPSFEALFDDETWDTVARLYEHDVTLYTELAGGTPCSYRHAGCANE